MDKLDNQNDFSDEDGQEEQKAEGNDTYKESFSLNSSAIREQIVEKQK